MSSYSTERDRLVAAVIAATRKVKTEGIALGELVSERTGLAATDYEGLQILLEVGPLTAGRLSELIGLTSGATTRMIDRLEQAGFIRRAADHADRRRIVVEPVAERLAVVGRYVEGLARATAASLEPYTDEQLKLIVDYLERSTQATRAEATRMRAESPAGASSFVAPVGSATTGQLVFLSGAPNIVLRADSTLGPDLYRASFDGPVPRVRVRDGMVTVKYGHASWFDWRLRLGDIRADASVHWRRDRGEIRLNAAMPWIIQLRGGASRINADLRGLDLRSFDLRGGASTLELTVGEPRSTVSIAIAGGVNDVTIHRPRGSAARLAVAGGASRVTLDGTLVGRGNGTAETPGAATREARFEISMAGGVNRIAVDEV